MAFVYQTEGVTHHLPARVKRVNESMAAQAAGFESFQVPLQLLIVPVYSIMAATNRASHPSGSSDQQCSAFALAA